MTNTPGHEPPGLPASEGGSLDDLRLGALSGADFYAEYFDGDGLADPEPPSEEELYGLASDPDAGPPCSWELMTAAQRRELLGSGEDDDRVAPGVPDVLDAGFAHRYGGHGTGFAAGGPLDSMLPGEELAWHGGAARRRGLDTLSDGELCGLIGAARRLGSWSAELELAAVAELDARRAGPDDRDGEHVAEEVAALLTLTGRSADSLLELSRRLARLPATRAMLAAGLIDCRRAAIIADHLALLSDAHAAAVQDAVLPHAPDMTTGELGSACQRAVKACDPQAAIRRRKKAEKDARVETWAEAAGTAAIAGRDLAPAAVIAADKTLDADARWLKAHGVPGGHDKLRAEALIARLTSQPLDTLLPEPSVPEPSVPEPSVPEPSVPEPAAASSTGAAAGGTPPGAAAFAAPAPGQQPWPAGGAGWTGRAGWTGGPGSSVNLTMPYSAWLGRSDMPGEIAGNGAADAGTCRDLAAALAASPATGWCITLVDKHGRAVAHGCARAGPGPPGTGDAAAWLATIKITPVETGTCAHRRESAGYRPSDSLRHIVKVRSRRCGFPGCRRPAVRCDDDHTIPYHKGGKSCECNLHPLCRRHHQTKQAPGWRLDQPEPGVLIWTMPSGRQVTVTPEPYPV